MTASPAPPRSARRWVSGAAGVAQSWWILPAAVAAWELWIRLFHVSPAVAPSPGQVFRQLAGHPGFFAQQTTHTIVEAVAGLAAGMLAGVSFAILSWWSAAFRGAITPGLLLLQSFPVVALVPLIAATLGYNVSTVFAITILISLFPAFAFTRAGMELPSQAMRDVFAVAGATKFRLLVHLMMPAAVTRIMLALRLSATNCILAALLAEFLMGTQGLGHIVALSQSTQQLPEAWAAALIGSILSLGSYIVARAGVRKVERRWSL